MTLRADYATTRREHRLELREAILNAAAELLATDGPKGLSVRAVAGSVGASTKVVYSHFGGKPGLIVALYEEGFDRLGQRLASSTDGSGSAASRILQLALAYRSFALESPNFYELMYGPRVRDLLPTHEDRDSARQLLGTMVALFEDGQERGEFRSIDPIDQARTLWATMHGSVSLELTTWFDHREGAERLNRMVAAVLAANAPSGDDRHAAGAAGA